MLNLTSNWIQSRMSNAIEQEIRYKSAAAARMADIPVTTLRVWERRYGVVSPPKTASGQRLYGPDDVERLVLLKGLVAQGHSIGTIAPLPTAALQKMAEETPARPGHHPLPPSVSQACIGVVGKTLSARVEAWLLQRAERAGGVHVEYRFESIAEAMDAADPDKALDILIVQAPSLRLADAQSILTLLGAWRCARGVVLYGFGTGAAIRTLQTFGITLRRGPMVGLDLDALIKTQANPTDAQGARREQAAPPRYTDAVLDRVAEVRTSMSCECPRHVAALISQLMDFERYSAECLADYPDDAQVHRELARTAGLAREMFERSLETLANSHGFASMLGNEGN
jgi:DNA-binding transcriptional MerR regulator